MSFVGFLLWSVSGTKVVIDLPKTVVPANAKVDDPIFDPVWQFKAQLQHERSENYKLRNALYAIMADLDTTVMNASKNQIPAYAIINIIKQYDTSPEKVYSRAIERRHLGKR